MFDQHVWDKKASIASSMRYLVWNSNFWFRFLRPQSEAEFRFRFCFWRFRLDFFLNSAVETLSNRNSNSKSWNSKKKCKNSIHLISYQKNGCHHTYNYSTPVAAVPTSTQHLSCRTYIHSTPVLLYLHLLNPCPAIPTSTQRLSHHTYIYSTLVPLYLKKAGMFSDS